MEGGSIQQGNVNVVPQRERLFESRQDPQISNHAAGYVYKLDDKKRLLRFLTIGADETYYSEQKELTQENAACVARLIRAGRGEEVVQTIKEISLSRRNIRQYSLLIAYAVCARSTDSRTKAKAYEILSEICRTPTHLFMFIKYCEEVSEYNSSGSGWGRAHKKAVCNWYTKFEQNPEKLARLITKYKAKGEWTHKDVLRLSHTCSKDPIMRFIFSYIIHGYTRAIELNRSAALEMDQETTRNFEKISNLMEAFDEASRCEQVQRLCRLITQHKLTWEQCNSNLLKHRDVWLSLLPHMPLEAMIRNLGRMSSYGMFVENSEEEQQVLDRIWSINNPNAAVQEHLGADGEELGNDRPWMVRETSKNFLHPIKIFFAWTIYKTGHGDRGNCTWRPNQRVKDALEEAFYRGYSSIEPTGKTFYLAVDINHSMHRPVRNSSMPRSMTCSLAAAAMMMLTARSEERCIIKAFSEKIEDLNIQPTDSLNQVVSEMSRAQTGRADCAQPMIDAIDMKRKDIDVFVIYTDSETWYGKVHPHIALCQYRDYAANKEVKLVVCGMCATDLTIADKEDQFMLDIAGFDTNTPWLISEFARGQL